MYLSTSNIQGYSQMLTGVQPEEKLCLLHRIDIQSLQEWHPNANWKLDTWFYDNKNLVYDVRLRGISWSCRFIMVRHAVRPDPSFEIIELSAPRRLFNGSQEHIRKVLLDWISYGWNERSTLLRSVKWAVLCMNALEAESLLASGVCSYAPQGLLVIHNTRVENADSICKDGISLKYARSGQGVWTRPPSYGLIDSTYFTGHLSFLIDVSQLRLKSSSSYAIVIGQDVPLGRVARIFDLQKRMDG